MDECGDAGWSDVRWAEWMSRCSWGGECAEEKQRRRGGGSAEDERKQ